MTAISGANIWVFVIVGLLALLAVWVVRTAGWRFAILRFAQALLIMVLVTFGTAVLMRMVDSSEVAEALGELGLPEQGGPCLVALGTNADFDSVSQCIDDRNLDENVFTQYGLWLKSIVWDGDLGIAFFKNGELLSDVIKDRGPRTGWLFLYSQLVAFTIAIPVGIWSAYQAGRKPRKLLVGLAALPIGLLFGWFIAYRLGSVGVFDGVAALIFLVVMVVYFWMVARGGPSADTTFNFSAFVLLSVPVFVIGETLRYLFSIQRGYYNLVGYVPWRGEDGWQALEHLRSLWLPALVLGLAASPVYLRLLRTDMVQNLQQDFVTVAKAKGLPNWKILLRHVLRPSSLTLLTVAGLNISQLVNGAIITEFIFDLDGMGSYLIAAVARREYFPVQTIVAITAVLFISVNTLIDVFYSAVDPRVSADADK